MYFDLRVANFIVRLFNYYIRLRTRQIAIQKKKNWLRLFKEDDKILSKLNPKLKIYHFKDSLLSEYINDGFEQTEIKFVRNFLKTDDIFFDIGANIGLFSLHAAQVVGCKGRVHAFEPTPLTYERLKLNVSVNNYVDIITCNNIGLSDKPGMLRLNVSTDGHDAWNTFGTTDNQIFQQHLDVPVITLDAYLTNMQLDIKSVSLIKIDVEGWESYVIRGSEALKNNNAPVLMVEFSEEYAFSAGTNCYELYDLIKSFGYDWYRYDPVGNKLISEPKRLHYPYDNLIAVKDINAANLSLKS